MIMKAKIMEWMVCGYQFWITPIGIKDELTSESFKCNLYTIKY